MRYEFSKSEKRVVRQVVETALQRDFKACIMNIDRLIQEWKFNKLDNRQAYLEIYRKVKENDKYIASMYDDITGSRYMMTLQGLLATKVITVDDLAGFSEKTRNEILGIYHQTHYAEDGEDLG
jgi:hypothetical protein